MKATNTNALLDQLRQIYTPPASDYRLAMMIGVSKTTISNYVNQKGFPDPRICAVIARRLGLPLENVLVMVACDRAQTEDESAAWDRVARKIGAI